MGIIDMLRGWFLETPPQKNKRNRKKGNNRKKGKNRKKTEIENRKKESLNIEQVVHDPGREEKKTSYRIV